MAGGNRDPSEDVEQRKARYLRMAAEAEASAVRSADPETQEAYLNLSHSWISLAGAIPSPADGVNPERLAHA